MTTKHLILFVVATLALPLHSFAQNEAGGGAAASAGAAGNAGAQLKLATASPSKIFAQVKETQEVKTQLQTQRDALKGQASTRRAKVEELQQQMEVLKPDSPSYQEANKQFMTAAIEYKNWGEISEAQQARTEKLQTKLLFDKITAAIAELAKERGIDLVFAEQPAMNIEKMNVDQLVQLLNQRQVLFSSSSVDLTADVVARLDARHQEQQKK